MDGKCHVIGIIMANNSRNKNSMYNKIKRNNSFNLNFVGINFKLSIPNNIEQIVFKDYLNYLPPFKITEEKSEVNIYVYRDKPSLVVDGENIFLSNESSPEQFSRDIILLISKFLEQKLNKKDIFSLHASAVSSSNMGIAMVGPNGSGKTTSAIYSCLVNKNIKFVSGNRLFIDGINIVSGTRGIRLRAGSLKSEFKLDNYILPDILEFQDKKVSVIAEDLGINANLNYPIRLIKIILVKKLEKELTVKKLDMSNNAQLNEAFLILHNSASEFNDNFPNFVLGSKIPYPNMFTDEHRRKRIVFVSNLLRNVESIKVEGRLEEIGEYISRSIRKK
jgi:hypothetical protein